MGFSGGTSESAMTGGSTRTADDAGAGGAAIRMGARFSIGSPDPARKGSMAGLTWVGAVLGSPRRFLPPALILAAALFGSGACASHHTTAPPPEPVPEAAPSASGQTSAPGPAPAAQGRESNAPYLPGTDRVFPSQDPRNHAAADAPEAFPAPAVPVGPSNPSGAAGEPSNPPGAAGARSIPTGPAGESGAAGEPSIPPAGAAGASEMRSGSGGATGDFVGPPVSTTTESRNQAPQASSPWNPDSARTAASLPPGVTSADSFSVQLFASISKDTAVRRASALAPFFAGPLRIDLEGGLEKVRVGALRTRAAAESLKAEAVRMGFRDAFVVRLPRGSGGDRP